MPRGGLHLERELNAVDDAVHAQRVTAVATVELHGSTGVAAVAVCYSSARVVAQKLQGVERHFFLHDTKLQRCKQALAGNAVCKAGCYKITVRKKELHICSYGTK